MELIIKNKSQSFEQIVIDLNVYLRSLPDWESWQDYFKTGSGQTIIELIAGLGTQLFYLINIQRQETYLQTAMNRSSVIGIAQMLGYSAGRGNAVKATITVKPDQVAVLNRFTIAGSCKGVDIIMDDSILLNEGVNQQIDVIIGTLKRDHKKIQSSALQPFRMTKPNITEDFILYKTANTYTEAQLQELDNDMDADKTGWIELPTSDKFIDMINDDYVVQTNVLSSVDIFYLNEGTGTRAYPYRQDETLIIDYVELSDTQFELSDLNFFYGEVISVDSIASYNPVETIKSIKVNAPLANEVQSLIRARNDAQKLIQQRGKNYISAVNSRDITPEQIEVTYIKNDFTLLSDLEYKELYEYIYNNTRPFGVLMPYISPPVRALLEIEIDVKLSNPLVRNTVTESIASMVTTLEDQFILDTQGDPTVVDLELVEEEIETLFGVKIARVYIKYPIYEENTYYRIGQFVSLENTNGMFKLEDIVKKSNNEEPHWPMAENELVNDGKIQWKSVKQKAGFGTTWQANHQYSVSDIVVPTTENGYMYEFHAYCGYSGATEPVYDGEAVVYDNEIIWFQITRNPSATEWQANHQYAVGNIVNLSSDGGYSYQMIEIRAKSNSTIPVPNNFGDTVTVDNMIWKYYNNKDARGDYKSPNLDYEWNQYLHVNYSLSISE